jgi:hypothetical protein
MCYEQEHSYWEEVERSDLEICEDGYYAENKRTGERYDAMITIKYKNVSGITPLICPNKPHAYSIDGFCSMCMPFKKEIKIDKKENLK